MANKNNQLELFIVERPNSERYADGNRYEYKAYITDYNFHVASFYTLEGMREFIRHFGLHLTLLDAHDTDEHPGYKGRAGIVKRYAVRERFHDVLPGFWSRDEVPADAKPIKLLSNGSVVDGYTRREGDVISVYRPNPNAKEVYKPMDLEGHINHQRTKYIF